MLCAKAVRAFEVGLYCADESQPFVAARGLDQIAAPTAEASDCGVDHLINSDATGRRIASITAALSPSGPSSAIAARFIALPPEFSGKSFSRDSSPKNL
jgi:hypothetical protein